MSRQHDVINTMGLTCCAQAKEDPLSPRRVVEKCAERRSQLLELLLAHPHVNAAAVDSQGRISSFSGQRARRWPTVRTLTL